MIKKFKYHELATAYQVDDRPIMEAVRLLPSFVRAGEWDDKALFWHMLEREVGEGLRINGFTKAEMTGFNEKVKGLELYISDKKVIDKVKASIKANHAHRTYSFKFQTENDAG